MKKRRNEGQRSWITRDKLFFVNPDDGFVYEQTCMLPYYYITEAKKSFKARPWTNRRDATSTPVTTDSANVSGYSGTTINSSSPMSFQDTPPSQRSASLIIRSVQCSSADSITITMIIVRSVAD